ncbi:TonB-dependent receptor [Phenylobacterium montanum]|uniref:TonB-dependent receptor n=1 Tax=Phenylobacterium montanum TaxID=2823693 RepID=A0A975IV03_9CAUL|nr:TonB-dependent receptor [Caulobacter sp. S6]QUD88338.1 TonB-dependent receptor [Caulobacter sp. S6]
MGQTKIADGGGRRANRTMTGALLAGVSIAAITALAPQAQAQTAQPAAQGAAAGGNMDVVIVTARKRDEAISKVPASITAFSSQALQTFHIQSFNDYATKAPNLSFSYGGGPTGISQARTVAIRGITGQNLVGTAGATGFYIDDTPLPGSVDPRVLDVDNVEVLKGPQGTLFGESSLGGNVRLITKKPSFSGNSLVLQGEAGLTSHGGSPDGGASAVGNYVVKPDVLAIRAVAFYNHDAGYLTRTYPTDPNSPGVTDPTLKVPRTSVGDQGAVTSYGGSVTALLKMTDKVDVRLRIMGQDEIQHGFQATFAPLPGFQPQYTIDRAWNVQPRASDVWALPSLDITYHGDGFTVINSTSYFYRQTADHEDSTYGTEEVFGILPYPNQEFNYGVSSLPNQPYVWIGKHSQREYTNEFRISFDPVHNISGTFGIFYSHTNVRFSIPNTFAKGLVAATAGNEVVGPWPNELIWEQQNPGTQEDFSVFGELYYKFLDKFTLTLGGREYVLRQTADFTADGFMNFGATPSAPQHNSQSGFDPKIGLAYQATDDAMLYASASKGFRAGGSQAFAPFCSAPNISVTDITNLRSDSLWSYEAGTKVQLRNPGILISAAGFHIDWKDIQQQVALPCGYYFDINGKSATVNGGEIEASGRLTHDLTVRFGLGYESTDITNPGALADVNIKAGSRILGTPEWSVTVGAAYTHTLFGDYEGFASADYSYTGNSVSLLNGGSGSESTRPAYSLVNGRFGVRWDNQEVAVNLKNLTNAKPNLGDIGYVGYAQFSTVTGSVIPQVATLQPMTVTVQYKRTF